MKGSGPLRSVVAVFAIGIATHVGATDLAWLNDRAAVHQFIDGVMASQVADGQVVGATVTIVRGGEFVLAQGYGVADRATNQPVDGTEALFRVGSVSKVFVWMAVMQQVAAGRLDLNTDVNTYLKDLQIPETFPEPITLTHLMTHTAGFEDRPVLGLFARGPQTVGDFHANLVSMMPRRVRMPGQLAAYSNYGAALAAHLVEIASNEDWDDYVDGHILKPLGMAATTTRQPVPPSLADHLSKGYLWENGHYVDTGFEFVTIPPAGSVSSTGADMGRFMIELLAHTDTTVLTSAARARLFEPGYAHDPRLNRMLHGLYEQGGYGQQLVAHNGDTLAFHSILVLCPALDLGIFASYNNEHGEKARGDLVAAFLDRLFGVPNPPQASAGRSVDADRYRGFYASLRVPSSGHDKIASLLDTFEVKVDDEGHLLLPSANGPRRFVKVDTDLFEAEDGRERVAFRGDGAQAMYLFPDSAPPVDIARVAPRDNPLLHIALLATVLMLSVAAWLIWPLSWLRHRGRPALAGEIRATLLAALTSAMIIGFCAVIGTAVADARELAFGLPPTFEQALWVPIALIPLLLLQFVYSARAWIGGLWWASRRIHYTLLTLAAIAFVVWAFYWHLTAVIVDF
jgi:CubicO group peptidase (beta-lactamase class C family)